jgi:hypothetical protein
MGNLASAFRSLATAPLCLLSGCITLLIIACTSSTQPAPKSTSYIVAASTSSFYKYGPAQAFGADLTLSQGQRLTMLSRQFGFSRVMLENGTSGFVSNDDIKPAPPTPVPKPTPAPSKGFLGRGKVPQGSNFKPNPQPLFDVGDIPPPPLPSNPSTPSPEKPRATPAFRF